MSETPSHTALARTYRPRRFSEVATQEHVAGTLRSAVARGRTAHAYLFCGPRGVGKTTAARVLAMALNCPDRTAEGEPCGRCESCERIWSGRTSLDVVEIDAASNRGVDDARDLRERAMYAPTDEHRFKVYIIDEAHMLTREAWNALLKILEEPPPRVIFVFATTEPQKIQQQAAPIMSRCQRFDFRRIAVPDILARLRTVLAEEGIDAEDDALMPIARRADGGLRDALSLLDQVLAFAAGRVTADDVRRVLGLIGEELYLELFDILADRRYADVFRFVQHVLDEGYDLAEFYRGLADALRALMVSRFEGPGAAEVREDLRTRYAEVAARFGTGDLLRMLAMVAELDTEGRFRKSTNPRTMLEALLLRFAYLDRTVDLDRLLAAEPENEPEPSGDPSGGRSGRPPASGGSTGPANAGGRARPAGAAPRSAPEARVAGPGAGPVAVTDPPARGVPGSGPQPAEGASRARQAPGSAEREGAKTSAGRAAVQDGPALSRARSALDSVRKHRRGLPEGMGFFLRVAEVVAAAPDRIELAGPGLFEKLSSDVDALAALERALAQELGAEVRLEIRSPGGGPAAAAAEAPAPVRLTPERVRADQLARMTKDQPVLRQAVQDWDLELLD